MRKNNGDLSSLVFSSQTFSFLNLWRVLATCCSLNLHVEKIIWRRKYILRIMITVEAVVSPRVAYYRTHPTIQIRPK